MPVTQHESGSHSQWGIASRSCGGALARADDGAYGIVPMNSASAHAKATAIIARTRDMVNPSRD